MFSGLDSHKPTFWRPLWVCVICFYCPYVLYCPGHVIATRNNFEVHDPCTMNIGDDGFFNFRARAFPYEELYIMMCGLNERPTFRWFGYARIAESLVLCYHKSSFVWLVPVLLLLCGKV